MNNFDDFFSKLGSGKFFEVPDDLKKLNEQNLSIITPEMEKAMDEERQERQQKNEEARLATLYTAEHTKQTAEEVSRLNLQVSELSIALESERARIKQLEKEKNISEYAEKIPALLWSLLAFIVTITIFYFENENISNKVSIFLLVALILVHIGAIIYNFVKMQLAKRGDEDA